MSEEINERPALIPVKAPWMVDSTTPFLHVRMSEDPNEEPSHVQFVGYFGPLAAEGKPYRIVQIILEPGAWLHMRPGHSDTDVINTSRFDTSRLPLTGEDPQEYLRRSDEEWGRTGICPDPSVYEVDRSPWLREVERERSSLPSWLLQVGGAGQYKHVIIVGHDYYIEVLTKGWRYELGEYLVGEAW